MTTTYRNYSGPPPPMPMMRAKSTPLTSYRSNDPPLVGSVEERAASPLFHKLENESTSVLDFESKDEARLEIAEQHSDAEEGRDESRTILSANGSSFVDDDAFTQSVSFESDYVLQDGNVILNDLKSGAFCVCARDDKTQLRIKVEASTINHDDIMKCNGLGVTKQMLPHVPGECVIGTIDTIEGVGALVNSVFAPGDRVIGRFESGGCTRFLWADATNFIKAPSGVSGKKALGLFQDWMPAYRALRVAKDSLKGVNLFGMNILITDAISAVGQAVIALASDEAANIYCCAEKSHHEYLESLSSRVRCVESQPNKWLPELKQKMRIVIDSSCIDGYRSSWEALASDGVLVVLPPVNFDVQNFDVTNLLQKMYFAKAKYFMRQTVTVDMKEEFKIDINSESGIVKRTNFMRDLQYLTFLHKKGLVDPKVEEIDLVNLQSVGKTLLQGTGGTLVCLPWN